MRLRIFWLTTVSFLLLFVGRPLQAAVDSNNFTIKSFTADYFVDKNNDNSNKINVREEIVALFPSFDQNHGILRAIPETYKDHSTGLVINGVTDELGTKIPYTTSSQNNNLVLKIGTASSYVHGLKIYNINYDEKDMATFYDSHDELYSDVNGDQWMQSFDSVTARVHIPSSISTALQPNIACYVGKYGANDNTRCSSNTSSDAIGNKVIAFSATNLSANETLTYVLGFNKGTFTLSSAAQTEIKSQNQNITFGLIALLSLPIIALIYMFRRWNKFGKDPKGRGTEVVEYLPPKHLSVIASGFIKSENLDSSMITASILELAIKRYINIYETKTKKFFIEQKTYKFKLIKSPSDLRPEEVELIVQLFGDNPTLDTEVSLDNLDKDIYTKMKKKVASVLAEEGYFRGEPSKVAQKYYIYGGIMLGLGIIIMPLGVLFILSGLGLMISGAIVMIFGKSMPARSLKGVEIKEYLKGLRTYIKMAEAERLKFSQSPEGAEKIKETGVNPDSPEQKVKLFERLLPYAVIFGLEKDWAKEFSDIYKQAPDWYQGNWATFNQIYFLSAISDFSSANNQVFAGPSSSGGSGFGGGFSGGGGGGGGGGGW